MQVKDFFVSFILLKSLGFNKAVARGVQNTHFSPAAEKSNKSDSHIKKKKKKVHMQWIPLLPRKCPGPSVQNTVFRLEKK